MNDSQRPNSQDFVLPQSLKQSKLHTPALDHVASPSPAKARRRPGTERPALSNADVAPVKLPSELFAIATSRSSQGDMALSKALDGIQAAATRLETERAKLVIQSQELQIWDMAREEELLLLRAEKEQLEQQLAAVGEKLGEGLGRDGVLDSLQFALRKARQERDAEIREADTLFNQLQEAKAAAQKLATMRAAFSAALCSIKDDWSVVPFLSREARELRARADAGPCLDGAVKDPTNLGQEEMTTLLRGLVALAARGSELQREVQTLRGEKTALQQALHAAHQNMAEQGEQHPQPRPGAAAPPCAATLPTGATCGGGGREPKAPERRSHVAKLGELRQKQQQHQEQEKVIASLQHQVAELQGKVAEYLSFLEDNQKEIEALQGELQRSRQAHHPADSQGPRTIPHIARALHGQKPSTHASRSSHGGSRMVGGSSVAAPSGGIAADTIVHRQPDQQQQKAAHGSQQAVQGVSTPTRHVPSCPSPNSTVNYAGSPAEAVSPTARGSPLHLQATADIAHKIAELQDLALRAQRQALEREAGLLSQHEAELSALRQELKQHHAAELAALRQDLSKHSAAELTTLRTQLSQQHNQALAQVTAQATAREAELSRQHTQAVRKRQEAVAQHGEMVAELHSQIALLVAQHAQAMVEREAAAASQLQAALEERTLALQHLHHEEMGRVSADAAARLTQALEEQAERLAAQHGEKLRELEARLAAEFAAWEKDLEAGFMEQVTRRESEMRRKHAERLAEHAAQLTGLHAEQAAGLGLQHAEAMADREAELCEQYEQIMLERESAHAGQVRRLEARTVARVVEAVKERETQLWRQFGGQVEEAARQQALAVAAEARLSDVEETARRREGEMLQQLEEQRRRVGELEVRLPEVKRAADTVSAATAAADDETADAIRDGAGPQLQSQLQMQPQVGDMEAVRMAESRSLRQQVVELEEQLAACKQVVAEREAQVTQQTQRHTQEMTALVEEGKRQRAALEREYVEIVARLGREHEKASVEARAAHELREANLRRALEQQTQAAQAKEAERLHKLLERLDKLQAEQKEERERHAIEAEALRARVAQLEAGLDALRHREAEATLNEHQQQQRMAAPFSAAGLTSEDPSVAEVPASTAVSETWPDGEVLLWPQPAPPAPTHSDLNTGGGCAAVSAQQGSDLLTHRSMTSYPQLLQQMGGSELEPVRCSDQDIAAKLLRTLRGVGKEDGRDPSGSGSVGLELWNSSVELSPSKVPRQGLLQGNRCMDRSGAAVPHDVSSASVQRLGKVVRAVAARCGTQARRSIADGGTTRGPGTVVECDGEEAQVVPQEIQPSHSDGSIGSLEEEAYEGVLLPIKVEAEEAVTSVSAVPVVSDSEAWGDLVGAPEVELDLPGQQRRPLSGAEPSPGESSSSPSKPASSVRTSSSYDSETEFYVDDDDDDEQRGRALAAALAQSPRASLQPSHLSGSVALSELQQQRRRSQSPGQQPPPSQQQAPDCPVGENRKLQWEIQQNQRPEAGSGDCETPLVPPAGCDPQLGDGGKRQSSPEDQPGEDMAAEVSLPSLDVDLQVQQPDEKRADSTSGAASGADLEATLSGAFPVLLPHALRPSAAQDMSILFQVPCWDPRQLPTATGRLEEQDAPDSAFCLTVPHSEVDADVGLQPNSAQMGAQDGAHRSRNASTSCATNRSRQEEVLRTSFSFPTVSPRARLEPALTTAASLGCDHPVRDLETSDTEEVEAKEEEDDRQTSKRSGISPTDGVGTSPNSPETSALASHPGILGTMEGAVRNSSQDPLMACSVMEDEASSPSALRDSVALQGPHTGRSRTLSQSSSSLMGPSSVEYSEGSSPTSRARGSGRVGPGLDVPLMMAPNPLYDERSDTSLPWSTAQWSAAGESSRTPTPRDADHSLSSTPGSESCRQDISRCNSHDRTGTPGDDGSTPRTDTPRQDCTAPATAATQPPGPSPTQRSGTTAQLPVADGAAGTSPDGTAAGATSPGTVLVPIGAKRAARTMSWGENSYGDIPDGSTAEASEPMSTDNIRLVGGVPVVAAVLSLPFQQFPATQEQGSSNQLAAEAQQQQVVEQHDGTSGDYYVARPRRRMNAFNGGLGCESGGVQEAWAVSADGSKLSDRPQGHEAAIRHMGGGTDHPGYDMGLTTGASTGGSCEQQQQHRRQRRRTGDAPEPMPEPMQGPMQEPTSPERPSHGRPIDLLRQSWLFAGGVATPLSPRSAPHHGRVQGHVVGHTSPPQSEAERQSQHTTPVAPAAPIHSPPQTTDVRLLPLRVLAAAVQSCPTSPGRDSPMTARRSSCSSTGSPSPSRSALPARGPASPFAAARRLSIGSPPVASATSRGGGGGGGPSPSPQNVKASADADLMLGSAGALDAVSSSPLPAALVSIGSGLVPSNEVRQRSRKLLGRAMSRVAELGDQCRALAAAMQAVASAATGDGLDPAVYSPRRVSEGPQEQLPPLPHVHGYEPASGTQAAQPAAASASIPTPIPTNPGVGSRSPSSASPKAPPCSLPIPPSPSWPHFPGPTPMRTLSSSQATINLEQLSLTPPPSVAEDVVGALDRLQSDLLELEHLHYLNSFTLPPPPLGMLPGSASTPNACPPPPSASQTPGLVLEGTMQLLLLDGPQAASQSEDVQAAAPLLLPPGPPDPAPPSAFPQPLVGTPVAIQGHSTVTVESRAPLETVQPHVAVAVPAAQSPPQGESIPFSYHPSSQSQASSSPSSHQQPREEPQEPGSARDAGVSAAASLAVNTSQPASATSTPPPPPWRPQMPPAVSPWPVQVTSPQGSPSFAATTASARNPMSGPSTPNLDPMLVCLLQHSIQVQLQGQLGQLHSKIAELQRQNEALLLVTSVASTPATPLPVGALLYQAGAPVASSFAVSPLPSSALTALGMPQAGGSSGCPGSVEGVGHGGAWEGGVKEEGGGSGMGGKQGRGMLWPAEAGGEEQMWAGAGSMTPVQQNRVSWAPPEVSSAPSSDSRSSAFGRTPTSGQFGNVLLLQAAASTAGLAPGHVPVSIDDKAAGPYSPEQLSQLPPTVQLFAPPQLRAAALASTHEQQLLKRTR